jgi:hypothetical protein
MLFSELSVLAIPKAAGGMPLYLRDFPNITSRLHDPTWKMISSQAFYQFAIHYRELLNSVFQSYLEARQKGCSTCIIYY